MKYTAKWTYPRGLSELALYQACGLVGACTRDQRPICGPLIDWKIWPSSNIRLFKNSSIGPLSNFRRGLPCPSLPTMATSWGWWAGRQPEQAESCPRLQGTQTLSRPVNYFPPDFVIIINSFSFAHAWEWWLLWRKSKLGWVFLGFLICQVTNSFTKGHMIWFWLRLCMDDLENLRCANATGIN